MLLKLFEMASLVIVYMLVVTVTFANAEEILFKNNQVNVIRSEDVTSWSVANINGKISMRGILSAGSRVPTQDCSTTDGIFCRQDASRRIEMSLLDDASCLHINTSSTDLSAEIRDCIDLEDAHWFGGAEQRNQLWPVEKLNLKDFSYVTKETSNMGVVERYWLNSNGVYLYVDSEVPLFIDQNNYRNNSLCFIAKNEDPYLATRQSLILQYSICGLRQANAKEAHYDAVDRFLTKPSDVIDERMVRHPIWSTWARYKGQISQSIVLDFANEILANGFNNSQLEIDDNWETCYGSLTFDTSAAKFPNMTDLAVTLKSLGFRVTLWIHPFVNTNCEPTHTEALSKGYLITTADGTTESMWWRGRGGTVDFTNEEAVAWWVARLRMLVDNELIDSFKFDAGESSFMPQVGVLNARAEEQPEIHTRKYVETCAQFGRFIEVRVAHGTQHVPVFVRMLDKDSGWGYNNGLKSLVTTLLQMNMVGYPFALPDMIGGNGYILKPTKELYIRWLQANTFMPALQFSFVPWDFDQETVDIALKYTALHDEYADLIMTLAEKAVEDGTPINPPIWWSDPEDIIAMGIDDEFLLGDSILIAPILDQGSTERDIYLPRGVWRDNNNPEQTIIAPVWIRRYSAPLDTLPYFTKVG